jgi:predicted nucleotide-binding protein
MEKYDAEARSAQRAVRYLRNGAKMNRIILEKLDAITSDAKKVASPSAYEAWRNRVVGFLLAALGDEASAAFTQLDGPIWTDSFAMQLGHLEGLTAKARVESEPLSPKTSDTKREMTSGDSRKVFVVHGHDNEAKETVARFIDRLGLVPIVLHEQANSGRTVIEKFETYSDVAFAVILLTPDDVGAPASEQKDLRQRARQNVIMELGYFLGKLGRSRVCALHKRGVEIPSDYQGVVYVELDTAGAWRTRLAQELVESKMRLDLKGLLGG